MSHKRFVYVFNYLKILNTVPKNNRRKHSPQQNKTAVLTTADYFKVCIPAKLQRQLLCFVYLCLPKRVFPEQNIHIRISLGTKL